MQIRTHEYMRKHEVIDQFKVIQDNICQSLEALDGKSQFKEDNWERPEGGGGRTRIICEGDLIEKGGVNFSAIHGEMPEKIRAALGLPKCTFDATGVSIVLHPKNPHMPIMHMNIRYFETNVGVWWFGGGIDLTPHYVRPEDAQFFHAELRDVCDQHDCDYYPNFKQIADDYFFIKHRNETRGIGGIFFDRLANSNQHDFYSRFKFVTDVGKRFVPIYDWFSQKYKHQPATEAEKQWQYLRRSRYVEFNLVYDKGTKFGLDTNGRIESILMSLPPMAAWTYNVQPEEGSREAETLGYLRKGIDW